ncbi:uncharacterized protein LOC141706774 [Apium graveolens]|uniref:uncharacterized protein LOC141706774 n=1 Tax=Apium graveolens TaxID=4045 RepID=UPI003D79B54B
MNSRTRLDYALFQLTPTRTRCDLVIFGGNASEKLASGLLEPFVSHLNSAKHQISRGGYSITLQPSQISPWFTKATLERFVKFVGTPEVLERFVTLEQELDQIKSSAKSNGSTYAEYMHSRKSGLQKEEAMAYARALVAGFEMDHIDDLIYFADAFGASRLRVACLNFKDLCNKKNGDGFWRDELATMQAFSHSETSYTGTSGMLLATKDNESSPEFMITVQNGRLSTKKPTESIDVSASESSTGHLTLDNKQDAKLQIPWTDQPLQYMHNFQGPVYPNMSPYPGHQYPGIQASRYYAEHTSWPQNIEDVSSGLYRDQNQEYYLRTTVGSLHGKASRAAEQEGNSVTTDSSSGCGSGEYGNSLISSEKDAFMNVNSLDKKVEEAARSLKTHNRSSNCLNRMEGNKNDNNVSVSNDISAQDVGNVVVKVSERGKSNNNWDIFQNLIMKEAASGSNVMDRRSIQKKYITTKRPGDKESVGANLASHGKQAIRIATGARERNFTNREIKSKASASSLRKSMSEIITRRNNPVESRTIVHKSKLEQEEEKRKKIEEIVTQRQKKIAERSSTKGITSMSAKGILQERKKTGTEPMKKEKVVVQVSPSSINKSPKPIFRSSTIDRLAASRITHKLPSSEHPRKSTKGRDTEIFSSEKTSIVGNKKLSIVTKIPEKKKGQNASNSLPYSASKTPGKKDSMTSLPKHFSILHGTQASNSVRKPDNSAKKCISRTLPGNSYDENGDTGISRTRNFNVPINSQSEKSNHMKGDNKVTSKAPHVHETTINPHEQRSIPGASEFSVTEMSTPPPEIHLRVEPLSSRKKWDNSEDSLKAAKGFRKLLLFGLTS